MNGLLIIVCGLGGTGTTVGVWLWFGEVLPVRRAQQSDKSRWAAARQLIENHEAIPEADRAWCKANGYDVGAAIADAEVELMMVTTYTG